MFYEFVSNFKYIKKDGFLEEPYKMCYTYINADYRFRKEM